MGPEGALGRDGEAGMRMGVQAAAGLGYPEAEGSEPRLGAELPPGRST